MSATGRSESAQTGHAREKDDFYATPAWATKALFPRLAIQRIDYAVVLDPCCGKGAILDVCAERWTPRTLAGTRINMRGLEIDRGRGAQARMRHEVFLVDALTDEIGPNWPDADAIITNPPYKLAMRFIRKSLAWREMPRVGDMPPGFPREVAFLLRVNFLASLERASFHHEHPANVYVLPRRPSFCAVVSCAKKPKCGWGVTLELEAPRPTVCGGCGGKVNVTTSDATEYAWFVWGPGVGGHWDILDVPQETP